MPLFPQNLSREPSALSNHAKTAANIGETADYIATLAAELAEMANAAQLNTLSYFLKMAQMEAESTRRIQSQVADERS
jgi:hypothetical protein